MSPGNLARDFLATKTHEISRKVLPQITLIYTDKPRGIRFTTALRSRLIRANLCNLWQKSLAFIQRLQDIIQYILHMFQAHRDADQTGTDANGLSFCFR